MNTDSLALMLGVVNVQLAEQQRLLESMVRFQRPTIDLHHAESACLPHGRKSGEVCDVVNSGVGSIALRLSGALAVLLASSISSVTLIILWCDASGSVPRQRSRVLDLSFSAEMVRTDEKVCSEADVSHRFYVVLDEAVTGDELMSQLSRLPCGTRQFCLVADSDQWDALAAQLERSHYRSVSAADLGVGLLCVYLEIDPRSNQSV
jgi:hypothetical protein